MKKILLIFLILMVLLLTACGNSTKNNIVGSWKSSGEESIFYNSVDFFSDGTHITETPGWSGPYATDGNRLRITGKLYGEVFTYEITNNGDELVLTNSLGYSKKYTRTN